MSPSPSPTETSPPNPTQKPLFQSQPPTTPSPWTHEETLNLIQTYQEKWYSLNRGQLKASQWDEVALSIAARCGLLEPSKSGTQCRHKMEKLRKRYRAEKLKQSTDPPATAAPGSYHPWIYFPLMDHLDRGIPITATASPPLPAQQWRFPNPNSDHTITAHNNLRHRGGDTEGDDRSMVEYKAKRRLGTEEEDGNGRGVMGELAGEMKGFVERFVMVERKKMEVMRENERFRLEMENKRLEMILVAHQKTADIISKAFASSQKKVKITPDL